MDEIKSIKDLFFASVMRDNPSSYLCRWDLQFDQDTREKNVFNIDFKDYKEGDLEKWFQMCGENDKPCYIPSETLWDLIVKSIKNDVSVWKNIGTEKEFHLGRIAKENAIDYFIPTMFKKDIHSVLDFGAGYGRQANLWSDGVYVGMDGVLNSYCVQHEYYRSLGKRFWEYMSPDNDILPIQEGITHLPTWQYDLLPDDFFDMVMCIQVLRELSTELAQKMLAEFYFVLKKGGILYIRDHDTKWLPCTTINIHDYLLDLGFKIAKTDDKNWKEIKDGVDLHGTPRVYIKS